MRLVCALAAWLLLAVATVAAADDRAGTAADGEQFFESQVRPMLVARCLSCHGSEKQEAGLRLDSREAILKGSDSGPSIVPGDPEKSVLVQALRYDGDVQMPPTGKLDESQVALFSTWVKMGAPWGGKAVAAENMPARAARAKATHWAYQPIVEPALPPVADSSWSANPVDRFIAAELSAHGLTPSPPATRATLLRRATFDLIGLPASAAEIEAFVNDPAPDAYARAIDRLLASPQYGQRWARYWLDVARYSDTKGYVFNDHRHYPYSYTYRNYVIRSFNQDRPYDEFLRHQIAADLMNVTDKRDLAALGFLTVGRRFSNNEHDIIDDRIDVVTRGMMGLTVTCARCHDHKYDPVPTDDYYSLYGVFSSCVEPKEVEDMPLIGEPVAGEAYDQFQAELARREEAVNDFRTAKQNELMKALRGRVKDYLCQLVFDTLKGTENVPADFVMFNEDDLRPIIATRWQKYVERTAREHTPLFALWHEFAALKPDAFAEGARPIIERLRTGEDSTQPVNRLLREAFVKQPPASMLDVARIYGEAIADAERQWQELLKPPASDDKSKEAADAATTADATAAPPTRLPDDAAEELRQVLYADDTPTRVGPDDVRRLFDGEMRKEFAQLRSAVEDLQFTSPVAPPRAMVLTDAETPHDSPVLLRGNPGRPDRVVPRHFVSFLSADPESRFTKGSGRLELAEAVTDASNPLTPRVAANRVWMHHFGTPLVATPGDFGLRSEPPTHPDLLNFLARQLIDEGWSLKRLHRLIMLSNTYQQASDDRPECHAVDPDNRLLWRAPRRRLDFEAMRDATLAAAGRLDTALEGRSVDLWKEPFTTRRSVYAYVDRQDLPGVFRMFDFASPDVSTPQRPETTVPQQALFTMNSPFVIEQARHLAARPEVAAAADPASKVRALYRAALARDAEADEVALAVRFVEKVEQATQSTAAAPDAPAAENHDQAAEQAADEAKNSEEKKPEEKKSEDKKPEEKKADDAKPAGPAPLTAWEQLAQALLLTNEFMFVD